MSERKVLNKYFPPDFDPALIPRRRVARDKQIKVRLITPFSMRCDTCGEYIYKGKKFNAKKELANEEYLGIQIFRFYIRCCKCSAEISFKTDPKNNDYKTEYGAQRKFEVWNTNTEDESGSNNSEEEVLENPMEALESRTRESKRGMDIADALDEIRFLNSRNELVDSDNVLHNIIQTSEIEDLEKKKKDDEEDSRLAREFFSNASRKNEENKNSVISPAELSIFDNSLELDQPQYDISKVRKRKEDAAVKLFGVNLKKKKPT